MVKKHKKTYRHEYAVGDVQGCYSALKKLLKRLDFDESKDRLWFAGDMVARGEDSLSTLRLIKTLHESGAAEVVLGNHDLNALAVWRGFAKIRSKDLTETLFAASDVDVLMHWLRQQPLMQYPTDDTVMCHAGIPPIWSTDTARALAQEVEQVLSGSTKQLDKLLPALYGKQPDQWDDRLSGEARLRCITNYFTRMRVCDKHGRLEFDFKLNPELFDDDMPKGFKPWYKWSLDSRVSKHKHRKRKVLFGHWAALEASIDTKHVRSLDAGCVWGGSLLAYRLGDGKVFESH